MWCILWSYLGVYKWIINTLLDIYSIADCVAEKYAYLDTEIETL